MKGQNLIVSILLNYVLSLCTYVCLCNTAECMLGRILNEKIIKIIYNITTVYIKVNTKKIVLKLKNVVSMCLYNHLLTCIYLFLHV